MKQLAIGLLVLGLTTACSHSDDNGCDIVCDDGFKTTSDDCVGNVLAGLFGFHGNCKTTER